MKIELNTDDIKPVSKAKLPDPDADQLAATMFNMRQAARMTQAEVAAVLGVERTSVTNYESGRCRVELRHLTKLAAHLGLEVVITLKPAQQATTSGWVADAGSEPARLDWSDTQAVHSSQSPCGKPCHAWDGRECHHDMCLHAPAQAGKGGAQ